MAANPIQVIVRPVRPEEYAPLGELTVAAYRTLPDVWPDAQQTYNDELRDVATRDRVSCVLVAVGPDGGLLGGVTYVRGPDDPFSEELREGEAGIRMLAVDPACHRRGVGRALVEACMERARSGGRRRIVLHTGHWMAAAKHLYEALGFEREPALDFTPVPGIDLLAYAIDLTAESRRTV